MEELTITVNIADRPYRLKIRREEEELIRRAVKEIDLHIRDYSDSFAFQDKQDLLAMVLLHFSSTSLRLEQQISDGEQDVVQNLSRLEQMLT